MRKEISIFLFFWVFIIVFAIEALPTRGQENETKELSSLEKLEILETFLTAEDEVKRLQRDNFTDAVIENLLQTMREKMIGHDFSEVIIDIQRKYQRPTAERRTRMFDNIFPTQAKSSLYFHDYIIFKQLFADILTRKDELSNLQYFYEFMAGQIEKYENDTEILKEEDKEEFADATALFKQGEYDLARKKLLAIKIRMDLFGIHYVKQAYNLIEELKKDNFTTLLLQDIYDSAKDEVAVAYFKDILKSDIIINDTELHTFINNLARSIERKPGDEYIGIDYRSVQGIVSEMNYTHIQIYRINESTISVSGKIGFYKVRGVNTSEAEDLFISAAKSFHEERYDEAETLLSRADSSLELGLARLAVTGVLAKESASFIKKHKITLIILTIILGISGPIAIRRTRLGIIKHKITILHLENDVLQDLIKRSQIDRFKTGIIDDTTYHIKLDKYMEKISKIKSTLPVLDSVQKRFEKLTKVESLGYKMVNKIRMKKQRKEE